MGRSYGLKRPGYVRMYFHTGTVQGKNFKYNAKYLSLLKPFKNLVESSGFRPMVDSRVNTMPIPIIRKKSTPLVPIFGYIQKSVQNGQIVHAYISTLM